MSKKITLTSNTGNWSAATNTGYQSAATNTGNQSAATNTGNQSAAEVSGCGSVAIAIGGTRNLKRIMAVLLYAFTGIAMVT